MKFLNKIIDELLEQNSDLSQFSLVLPGKRPVVFIKKILREKRYTGLLPQFISIEDLIKNVAGCKEIKGISLWLYAYRLYREIYQENFYDFLKWFPTILKDWNDILKFCGQDKEVFEFMIDEEKLKNWVSQLGENSSVIKNLDFWEKMNHFFPLLKQELMKEGKATEGMIHEMAKDKIEDFVKNQKFQYFVFCGFNALTPVEKLLIKAFLKEKKARCFFHADEYYIKDERQEAGKFLREYVDWDEFRYEDYPFQWIEKDFAKEKKIKVYEASGNITQTKILPEILKKQDLDELNTAIVLLDENLLSASIDTLSQFGEVNITMGYPLKNLSFSNTIRKIIHIQKNLRKNHQYYYHDLMNILESLSLNSEDRKITETFLKHLVEHNIVYITKEKSENFLKDLSFKNIFEPEGDISLLIEKLIDLCYQLKNNELDDVLYESISYFESVFKIIKNQIEPYDFKIDLETLEVLMNQLVNMESVDFEGEPLSGLQVMGLLETRLLNFENIILLSINEGKLPLGNTQNTYIPFDVRRHFGMHTFLENDGIYAYHFYRLLQESQKVHLIYNGLDSGVNVGEKSRFITQIEMESNHQLEHVVINNDFVPVESEGLKIEKTEMVMEALEQWLKKVSPSHLISYLYNPIDFYLKHVLKIRQVDEIEEELSVRNYGNLVHGALQLIYEKLIGEPLTVEMIKQKKSEVETFIDLAITEILKYELEYYSRGMNYIHKMLATRVVKDILDYDLKLVESGNSLEILHIEDSDKVKNIEFDLDEGKKAYFYGIIDRIDCLNGKIRIIDYKTASAEKLKVDFSKTKDEEERWRFLHDLKNKQILQLSIYQYCCEKLPEFSGKEISCGIWSFASIKSGVQSLEIQNEDFSDLMNSIKSIIQEILEPNIFFEEVEKKIY